MTEVMVRLHSLASDVNDDVIEEDMTSAEVLEASVKKAEDSIRLVAEYQDTYCLYVCRHVWLLAHLSTCLPLCLPVCLPVCLSACLPACQSIHYICVCLTQ